jgi:hypothetical protein
MVCVDSLLGTAVRFNVGRNNSHKVGQLPDSSRHCLTFGMLPSERATCGADPGIGNCFGAYNVPVRGALQLQSAG